MLWALSFLICIFTAKDGGNLLKNGGFEDYHNCPTHTDNFYELKDWFRVTGSPNYYNCGIARHPTKNGVFELDSSFEGTGYIGIGLFSKGKERGAESIGQSLQHPIEKGHGYTMTAMVKPASSKKFNTSCIKLSLFGFSKDPLGMEKVNICAPDSACSLVLGSAKVKPAVKWEELEIKFVAPGNCSYIVLSPECAAGCNAYVFLDALRLVEIQGP